MIDLAWILFRLTGMFVAVAAFFFGLLVGGHYLSEFTGIPKGWAWGVVMIGGGCLAGGVGFLWSKYKG